MFREWKPISCFLSIILICLPRLWMRCMQRGLDMVTMCWRTRQSTKDYLRKWYILKFALTHRSIWSPSRKILLSTQLSGKRTVRTKCFILWSHISIKFLSETRMRKYLKCYSIPRTFGVHIWVLLMPHGGICIFSKNLEKHISYYKLKPLLVLP